ncbi:Crp/Fnr family transcriptional regulator [Nocardia miyunensis]|uniref:Crp/Fnr family transcriptional regulator n=1 Tax=Nocardia miyunensis TaxID=282684 RepID=UPI000835E6A3|nr:cyclic nucleotide-binding domain-containing protein [Nocardia miyunensis]
MTTVEDLSVFPDLAGLTEDELTILATAGRDVTLPTGLRVITEGRAADRCWLIRSGLISLDTHIPGRGDIAVQTLTSGELLGWSWLAPPYRWRFDARVLAPVEAIEFDAATLIELASRDPVFGRTLLTIAFHAVLERLQGTRARLLDLYRNPADAAPGTALSDSGDRS